MSINIKIIKPQNFKVIFTNFMLKKKKPQKNEVLEGDSN